MLLDRGLGRLGAELLDVGRDAERLDLSKLELAVRRGKTPVLSAEEARKLLDSIEITTLIGLRDRALIGSWSIVSPG